MKRFIGIVISVLMLMTFTGMMGCSNLDENTVSSNVTERQDTEGTKSAATDDNLKKSRELLKNAINTLKTTDNHDMMAAGTAAVLQQAAGSPEDLEKLEDDNIDKWHYYEYLDWDTSNDAKFPASPADGQNGKKVILIVHGSHAWTTCYEEAFKKSCDAVGISYEIYDPNWDQSTQDGYIDQAINEKPDAIILIPVSADHAAIQFKKITDAGIPALCSNTLPESDAMNQILAYTGPNDWAQMRNLANELGKELNGQGGVCYVTHNVGSSPYYARTFGPMSTLAEKYPDIKNLDVQSPGFEASAVKQVVSDWITKYGKDLNAIVLADDSDQAIGAVEACEAAGRSDISIIAAGVSKQGAELVQSGKIKMVSYQSCQADAGLAVRTVSEYFCGDKIERVSYIGTDIITKDNVSQFLPTQW